MLLNLYFSFRYIFGASSILGPLVLLLHYLMKPEGKEIVCSVLTYFTLAELLVNEIQFAGQELKTLFCVNNIIA